MCVWKVSVACFVISLLAKHLASCVYWLFCVDGGDFGGRERKNIKDKSIETNGKLLRARVLIL